jgi:hypothetical protein
MTDNDGVPQYLQNSLDEMDKRVREMNTNMKELTESVSKLEKMVNAPPRPRTPSAFEKFIGENVVFPLMQIAWYIEDNATSIIVNGLFIGGVVLYAIRHYSR